MGSACFKAVKDAVVLPLEYLVRHWLLKQYHTLGTKVHGKCKRLEVSLVPIECSGCPIILGSEKKPIYQFGDRYRIRNWLFVARHQLMKHLFGGSLVLAKVDLLAVVID